MIIYEAPSRFIKNCKSLDITWPEFIKKFASPVRTGETIDEYMNMNREEKGNIKDVGGFIGGALLDGKRSKNTTLNRCLITLDMDNGDSSALEALDAFLRDKKAVVYSTHTHTPETPRLRVILALKEALTPDEYTPVARYIAAQIGIDAFDDTTYEACRLMYYPSTCKDGEYYFKCYAGEEIDGKAILKEQFTDWTNATEWPLSSRESERAVRSTSSGGKLKDPTTKSGIVGEFCKAYNIHEVITEYLPDVYLDAGNNRYTFAPANTSGGLVVYDDVYAYSHHASDPVSGCGSVNAFDLVRIHKYGSLDEEMPLNTLLENLPSTKAMINLARNDTKVRKLLGAENDLSAEQTNAIIPITDLPDLDKYGMPMKSPDNIRYIFQHDKNLSSIAYNGLLAAIVVNGSVPWSRKTATSALWCEEDISNLFFYIYSNYKIRDEKAVEHALRSEAGKRYFHPIKDYLNQLPDWDGIPRVEDLLINYIGALDSEYTKKVTKLALVGGVARIMQPAIKFDYCLVLCGNQGLGKSSIFAKLCELAGDTRWFTDSLSMSDMGKKEGIEATYGTWIIEIPELSGLKKTEIEAVKAYITRREDRMRPAYGRGVQSYPRQCIFIGTTNNYNFLRDEENRRFLPVDISSSYIWETMQYQLTKDIVDQIWAEALHYFNAGMKLYFTSTEMKELIKKNQVKHLEENEELTGIIETYLDVKLPEDWNDKTIDERASYCYYGKTYNGWKEAQKTGHLRQSVSAIEVWCEALGRGRSTYNKNDPQCRAINNSLKKLGWIKGDDTNGYKSRERCGPYGQQYIYYRPRVD